ncbi:13378_t:CDS:2 [Funneliformis geosporum]|uniref:13378_t:CDS:1 n=1 Tax=Funneliformis geosporum TaxID=1117311 RepID=A0A9W4SYH1_9GLOM|nr:13378_t:CDS:2 [Funneliformis geosporum]
MDSNSDFVKCFDCGNVRSSTRWCKDCECNAFKENFRNWASGNLIVDNFIKYTQLNTTGNVDYLEYIDFDQFEFMKKINKGGDFGTIYSATWMKGPRRIWDEDAEQWTRNGPIKVALARLHDSQNINEKYLKQLYEYQYSLHESLDSFGITLDLTSNYMLVMKYHEYYENRDLYSFLDETQQMICWKDVVLILWQISGRIVHYHEKGLIHGNIHGGNILVEVIQGSFGNIDIPDIEPYSINKENSNEIYGVLPYVAPEILQGKPLTESVDIYSFGMIMWTLSAGVLPWCNRPHDSNLASQICSGLRPEIRTPNVYTQLMTRCWDSDPSSRPTTSELNDELETWLSAIDDPNPSELSEELSNLKKSKFDQQEIHSEAFYTSRMLSFL